MKYIILSITVIVLLIFTIGITIYLVFRNDSPLNSTEIPNSYSEKKNTLSYMVSYPLLNESTDPITIDATKGWSDYQFSGFKIKYPKDELEVQTSSGSEIKFKNLKNKDFTYGLKVHIYNASDFTSSMNLLENFVVTVHGTIPNQIHKIEKFKNFEIAQIGNYFNVDGDGFYDLMTAVKIGNKGVIFETAFISEEDFNKTKDLANTSNDFIYKLIITSLQDLDSTQVPPFKLAKPSPEAIESYRSANSDKSITL